MNECFILINTGSRVDEPCKAFVVDVVLENGVYSISGTEQIPLVCSNMPAGLEYRSQGVLIAEKIYEYIKSVQLGTILGVFFRCPALRRNIQDLYYLTEEMVEDLSSEAGKLAPGLKISHGSEIAFWIAVGLKKKIVCPIISSCGIPTDKLPREAKVTGIPGVRLQSLSHWESVAGLAAKISKETSVPIEDVKFILIMLGSGFGVYAWMQNRIVSINVRHMNGAMSQSSIGATVDYLALLDYFKREGITDIDCMIKTAARLSGKNGGLCMYDPRYGDLKVFASDVRSAIQNPTEENLGLRTLFNALVLQLVESVGRARMAMSCLGEVDTEIPVYFFGGGANWIELCREIQSSIGTKLFSQFERITNPNQDPEMYFFSFEILRYLNGTLNGMKIDPY